MPRMTPDERIAVALERIADHFASVQPQAPLTAEEVAKRLGVSIFKVYGLARDEKLRHTKIGRSVRFRATDVDEYLQDVGRSARPTKFQILR
jgi:excisionase family DNA binding protein